jgi:hypothetical protein
MKNAVFWDVTPRDSFKNRRFGECIATIIRVKSISELGTMLAVTSNQSTLRRNNNHMRNQTFPWLTRVMVDERGR